MDGSMAAKKKPAAKSAAPVIAYKAFDPGMKSRDFQFAVGQTYEVEGDIELCNRGFHDWTGTEHPLLLVKSAKVGAEGIEPNVAYPLTPEGAFVGAGCPTCPPPSHIEK